MPLARAPEPGNIQWRFRVNGVVYGRIIGLSLPPETMGPSA